MALGPTISRATFFVNGTADYKNDCNQVIDTYHGILCRSFPKREVSIWVSMAVALGSMEITMAAAVAEIKMPMC